MKTLLSFAIFFCVIMKKYTDNMGSKRIKFDVFNPLSSCRRYHISPWQCPQFLFLVMGVIIAVAIVITYLIAILKIGDPTMVVLLVLVVGGVLLVINFIITNSFERIVEASRLKTEFIGVISHQLRTPLTNLRFSLDFLTTAAKEEVAKKEAEYFAILKENAQRMGDLIDNLITVSKIDSGDFPLKRRLVSLKNITENSVLKFGPFAEASNVVILLKAEEVPDVFADPLWLEQVVDNLLDNAIRYTKGGGEIKLKIQCRGPRVYFEIQDSGVGIPREEQKYIFEKFFRSQNALKRQTHGSGLGLYIVKKVVELLGGRVGFRSEENAGTTFYFLLPIKNQT